MKIDLRHYLQIGYLRAILYNNVEDDINRIDYQSSDHINYNDDFVMLPLPSYMQYMKKYVICSYYNIQYYCQLMKPILNPNCISPLNNDFMI